MRIKSRDQPQRDFLALVNAGRNLGHRVHGGPTQLLSLVVSLQLLTPFSILVSEGTPPTPHLHFGTKCY